MQAQALLFLNMHGIGYKIALVFFVFSIVIQGYLIIKSGYFPRLLGVLMFVAAAGYTLDNVAAFMLADYDAYAGMLEMVLMATTLPIELILGLWLLIKGGSIQAPEHETSGDAALV